MRDTSYLYDKRFFEQAFSYKHFCDKCLGYSVLPNAYIVPWKGLTGGVYTESKEFLTNTAIHDGYFKEIGNDELEESFFLDEKVIYLGPVSHCWGHCITDCLRYLWFFNSEYYEKYKDCKLAYLSVGGSMPEYYMKHFMECFAKYNAGGKLQIKTVEEEMPKHSGSYSQLKVQILKNLICNPKIMQKQIEAWSEGKDIVVYGLGEVGQALVKFIGDFANVEFALERSDNKVCEGVVVYKQIPPDVDLRNIKVIITPMADGTIERTLLAEGISLNNVIRVTQLLGEEYLE